MRFKKVLTVFISLVLISCMSTVLAQDEEKSDGLARLVLITAKDGHENALEEAITNYHHYMAGKKGAWRYQWYSILTGPDTGKYFARSGDHNWEDFDATHDWDEESNAKFAAEVSVHVEDADIMITNLDDEIGHWPDSMEGYQYFSITRWHVKNGMGGPFRDGLKKINGILKENNWPGYYTFGYTNSGGKGNMVSLIVPYKSYADMAPKEPSFMDVMNKAMGEEETGAFMKEWGSTFKTGEYFLIKYRPDLSDYGDGN